ncbi:MAG TPA: DUF4168 domain-containing protein [Gammaproteobacteria bacterium]|jgi:hypothetical protein|nr:DUF4168 domain-containing protein [Gammaproteobacteria bacterium]
MSLKLGIANSVLALVLTLGAGAAAYAQDFDTPTMNPATVSEAHLEKFANVNVKAQEIQEKYKAEVDGIKNLEDLTKVQQKMNGELVDAIQGEDMSVEEYQEVSTAVQQSPELRSRVMTKINEKRQQQTNK